MMSKRILLIVLVTCGAIAAAFLLTSPISQDLAYHEFAGDHNTGLIPNLENVISNAPFCVVALLGAFYCEKRNVKTASIWVTIAGVFLTGLGSAWYHWAPNNITLVWDRIPMTIIFSGFFSWIVFQTVSKNAGRKMLVPMLVVGTSTVLYWIWTETLGCGDLRPYALVQFGPMVLIPILLWTSKRWDLVPGVLGILGFYVLAKIFEHYDHQIHAQLADSLGGHVIKHLWAAVAAGLMIRLQIVYSSREYERAPSV